MNKLGFLEQTLPETAFWRKAWHKRYFVLRDETQDRSPCLRCTKRTSSSPRPRHHGAQAHPGPGAVRPHRIHLRLDALSLRPGHRLPGQVALILAAEGTSSAPGHGSWRWGSSRTRGTPAIANVPPSILPHLFCWMRGGRRRNKHVYRETCSLPQESSAALSVESTAATLLPEEYNDNDMDPQRIKSRKKKEASNERLDEPATKRHFITPQSHC
ncbi:hypothetical protein CEXT_124441 [Caerostris extrusa]|uniref:PH domain-containing protein n=1 Tax=Caerostris extrusa TaxID=172846 RepID=A0AAV4SSA6_CAEEX|nr:hypothetical protein CEXT_124441 [Caerostris extrusa]